LKTQLFDVDLKIKRGLKGSTLTAFFVLAFFLAEQVGQVLISERAGPYVGIAGAGVLALGIVPLRRLATRVADRAMPHVRESPDYIAARKLHVYRAAVESAMEDGRIDERERAMLNRLAAELVIGPESMVVVEREVEGAPAEPT
jgi:uncharacterized membrane protein YebE (DUF533 family)